LAAAHGAEAQSAVDPETTARAPAPSRVMVLGDSHTASDLFTAVMRRELQARFGAGGPGFVFPAPPWPSYRREEFTVSGEGWRTLRVTARDRHVDHYGLAGVALECAPDVICTAELARREASATTPYDAELWLLARPGGGTVDVFIDDALVAAVSTGAETHAPLYVPMVVPAGARRLHLTTRADGAVRVFGVVLEQRSAATHGGVVVDALGINGARARDQLAWDDALARAHLARRAPNLVVLAYGTNEIGDDQPLDRYAADLRGVVARVRETLPDSACLLVGPTDRPERLRRVGWVARPRQEGIIQTQREVAREFGCGFFDTVAFQGGPLSTVAWARAEPPLASRDHVHLTRLGYERLGLALVEAVLGDEVLSRALVAAARASRGTTSVAATSNPHPHP
jgi:lysophospholipase L1-like esterase